MKKIILTLLILFINVLLFGQGWSEGYKNPYDSLVVKTVTDCFNLHPASVEATVVSTQLDSVDGRLLNIITIKLHRSYSSDISNETEVVYMIPDYVTLKNAGAIPISKNGIQIGPCHSSHGGCPYYNPEAGITGHFFLVKKIDNGQERWYINEWIGYPNRAHYDYIRSRNGITVDFPRIHQPNSYYTYSVFGNAGEWNSLDELHSYLSSIDIKPVVQFNVPAIERYVPLSPREKMKLKSDSIDALRKIERAGIAKQKEGLIKLKRLEELLKEKKEIQIPDSTKKRDRKFH
jgi:hypothetical protein